ncbi:hypothetical protein IZY60_11105 [Lutibacter sp. B2]|nr:hypothetical protein [Lutibacter sp. B2]
MILRVIIYGLAGWCIEVFWTGFNSLLKGDVTLRGWTYIWMFFIYGLAIFLEPIHNRLRKNSIFVRGGVYTLLIFAVEFATGMLLRNIIGVCPWDYSSSIYSVGGLIRLDYAPLWCMAGLLFEKLHDTLISSRIVKA